VPGAIRNAAYGLGSLDGNTIRRAFRMAEADGSERALIEVIGAYRKAILLSAYRRIQSYYGQSRRREKCPRSSAMQTIPVPLASKHPNHKINKRNRKDSADVSQIIHEIMNQLSVIWFCNHQLRDLLVGDLDEAQRKQFEIIARAVNTTAELAAKLNTNITP
jgi:hypothetical protein